MEYASYTRVESKAAPGVSYLLARMSFGRRMELTKRIRDLAQRAEFLEAGSDPKEKIEAAILSGEVDRLYVTWGVREITGLTVDGEPATPELLAEAGPEEVFREAVAAVRAECGLTDAERKN